MRVYGGVTAVYKESKLAKPAAVPYEFIDIAIRILWSSGKDIPNILVRNNENISWQELGHSFIAGLTSNGVNNNNEEVNEDGNE